LLPVEREAASCPEYSIHINAMTRREYHEKDRRYSLLFLLNDGDDSPLTLATAIHPFSSPTSSAASSSRSSFEGDWSTASEEYNHHTPRVSEVMERLSSKMQTVKERIRTRVEVRQSRETSPTAAQQHRRQEIVDTRFPVGSRRRSDSPVSTSPSLPGQSSFLYCKKKITRKQAKRRRPTKPKTVFYNCSIYEGGRQLLYTREAKGPSPGAVYPHTLHAVPLSPS
jgi:hypothetical protein